MAGNDLATFGDLIRRARRAANLSQEDLASRAGLSARAISDLERGVNRTPRSDTLDMLADALNLPDDERLRWKRARRQIRNRQRATRATQETVQGPAAGDLPLRLTSFVGRLREIAALQELILQPSARLVTVTGPGGIGKTSLAAEVARRAGTQFSDGARFVSLAPIQDPALVPAAIAASLGLADRGTSGFQHLLVTYLSDRQMLLILDNFEHLIAAAPLVTELLLTCPSLTVLVTSRTVLHLSGEHEFQVAPLDMPLDRGAPDLDDLRQQEAIALFVQRAQQHKPDFQLTESNAGAVVELCRTLDGIPLAIELAAARVRQLPPVALLARFGRRLPLLTGGPRDLPSRQQTMRDTVAWSYDLLTVDQQQLLRQLSVFVGGWTVEAAELLCEGDSPHDPESGLGILDAIGELIDQSLVQQIQQADGSTRFTMLETVREYALEQLETLHDLDTLRDRHARTFYAIAKTAAPHLDGTNPTPYLNQLEADHDNLRAALTWLRDVEDIERGLAMVGNLREFWYLQGHLAEGHRQAATFLNHPTASAATTARAMALVASAWLALWQGLDDAISHSEEAIAIWRHLGDETQLPFTLITLGIAVDHLHGDMERANSLNEQALEIARSIGDAQSTAKALHNLGAFAWRTGNEALAISLNEESIAVGRGVGLLGVAALGLGSLGQYALVRHELDRAAEMLQQRLRIYVDVGDTWGIVRTLDLVAAIAVRRKQPESALRLFAAAATLRNQTGIRRSPNDRDFLDRVDAELVELYGETAFQAAWEEARWLPPDKVIREALDTRRETASVAGSSTPQTDAGGAHKRLSKREHDILRLVAEGRSNKEIAAGLSISPHTVARHVQNIMAKLGLESRTAIATYAVRHELV